MIQKLLVKVLYQRNIIYYINGTYTFMIRLHTDYDHIESLCARTSKHVFDLIYVINQRFPCCLVFSEKRVDEVDTEAKSTKLRSLILYQIPLCLILIYY